MRKSKYIINPGDKFNDWTIVKEVWGKYKRRFICENGIGIRREIDMNHLISGASKGTFGRGETNVRHVHGLAKTRIWRIWMGIKARCKYPRVPDYKNYGGRGITVCDRWLDFVNFYEDMKEGYSDELSIDRIDVNGNYCKENCRWADTITQNRNTRRTLMTTYRGKEWKVTELAEKLGIKYTTLRSRLFVQKQPLTQKYIKAIQSHK